MKKIISFCFMFLLGACSGYRSEVSVQEATALPEVNQDLTTCLTREASARVEDGSASASPLRITIKKMLNACLDKNDQSPEAKQEAQNILKSLMK